MTDGDEQTSARERIVELLGKLVRGLASRNRTAAQLALLPLVRAQAASQIL